MRVSNKWQNMEEKWKVTFRLGENETKIDYELIKKRTTADITKCEGNP